MNTEPLRSLLLKLAADDAQSVIAAAESEAATLREAARSDATAMVAAAEHEAHAIARRQAGIDLRAVRRLERAEMLAAEREVEAQLRRDAAVAVLSLRQDPSYPRLLDGLSRLAAQQLGPRADIERDPPGRGGVIARAGTRTLDLSLQTLADRALDTAAIAQAETVEAGVA